MKMFCKALIFVLFASGMVLAQFRTANLSGTVADEAGMPLGDVGVKVTFLTPSRDFVGPTLVREVWSGRTQEDGDYKVRSLLLGSYQVEASLAGFDTNFRWVPLRTSADEMILDITLKAEEVLEAEQIPPPVEPPPVVPLPTEPPAVEEAPSSQPDLTSSRGVGLAIQIAAFQTRQKAEGLEARLQDAGFTAYVVETDVFSGSARYYRVRVGPFDTREEARGVASNVRNRFPREMPDFWIVSY